MQMIRKQSPSSSAEASADSGGWNGFCRRWKNGCRPIRRCSGAVDSRCLDNTANTSKSKVSGWRSFLSHMFMITILTRFNAMTVHLATLQTEQKNSRTTNIDTFSSLELCRKMAPYHTTEITCHVLRYNAEVINEEDHTVATAVKTCLPQIAAAIDVIVPRLLKGGRVVYTGAGTSGR